MKSISQQSHNDILSLLDQGKSSRKIALETGVHYSTVSKLRSQLRSALPKAQGGWPSKLNSTTIHHAIWIISTGRADTATQVTKSLQETLPESVSVQTVRRALKKTGLKAVVKAKRPALSQCHCRERLDFAKSHQHWTLDDWKRVIWSDETKINHLGSDGRKWVWKKAGEGLSGRLVDGAVKFGGGNLMMWGCMCWEGVGFACSIDGRMDADLYVSI